MNKRLFLIWFGDNTPDFVEWTVNNYKIVNPSWNVIFIHYSRKQLENYKDQNDTILIKSVYRAFEKYGTIFNPGRLADVYRSYVLTNDYDTYVDIDTFPISQLDDFLMPDKLDVNRKTNIRYLSYCGNHKSNDLWFLSKTNISYVGITNISKKINLNDEIIYHNFTYMNRNEIDTFEKRKIDFLNCNIQIGNNFCCEKFSPIEHYNTKLWTSQNKNGANIFNKILK